MTWHYTVKTNTIAGDTCTLTLVPQNTNHVLAFTPGQYATIQFKRNGRFTPARCFSITSTPSSGILQFAMRVQGAFTQTATTLQPGEIVQVQGPFGSFTLNPLATTHAVLIAGGIGITPFISMLRTATEQQQTTNFTLLHSNRSVNAIPFYPELVQLQQQNPNITTHFYCGDSKPNSPANIHTGRISPDVLATVHSNTPTNTAYFICGPKAMTVKTIATLQMFGVPSTNIHTESFSQTSSIRFNFGTRQLKASTLTYALAAATLVVAVGGITTLDLLHTVPRLLAQAQTASGQLPTAQTDSYNQNSSDSSDTEYEDDDASSSTTNDSYNPTPTTTQQTPQTTQTYQAPTSHVS